MLSSLLKCGEKNKEEKLVAKITPASFNKSKILLDK